MHTNWHGIFYIIKVALFGLIKKAFYTRGIWEALGYMLWHGYTTCPFFCDFTEFELKNTKFMSNHKLLLYLESYFWEFELEKILHKGNIDAHKLAWHFLHN